MISISINKLGKKFNREWIFRNVNFEISAGDKLVILGGNGSGKSTLLQVISGFVTQNEGEVLFKDNGAIVDQEKTKNLISFASPYLQLVEEFTLIETINHAAIFKPFGNSIKTNDVLQLLQLEPAKHKFIKQFSSGMKQRLKLGLAILANTPVLLLDEPVSNLDRSAIEWYRNLLLNHAKNRTIIVCSNAITDEYFFCDKKLDVTDYKK